MFGKISDGVSMVWANLDDRERFMLVYGGLLLVFAIASALSTPRRDERERELQPTLPVVVVWERQPTTASNNGTS